MHGGWGVRGFMTFSQETKLTRGRPFGHIVGCALGPIKCHSAGHLPTPKVWYGLDGPIFLWRIHIVRQKPRRQKAVCVTIQLSRIGRRRRWFTGCHAAQRCHMNGGSLKHFLDLIDATVTHTNSERPRHAWICRWNVVCGLHCIARTIYHLSNSYSYKVF